MNHLYSIRTQLTILLTVVVTIVYGFVAFFEINEKSSRIEAELHQQIAALLSVQVDALAVPMWNFDLAEVERQLGVLVTHSDITVARVVEANGDVLATASSLPNNGPGHHQAAHQSDDRSSATEPAHHIVDRDIRDGGNDLLGRLIVETNHDRIAIARNETISSHIKQFLIITLVIMVTIAVSVTSLVRPVLKITEAMGQVADGDLHVAIPATERRDEIGIMARALEVFKANAAQLQETLDRERELNGLQRQFVSMVSHEFRTPLAVIDGNAQRLLRRLDKVTPERLKESLEKVRVSVTNLTGLMESVLNTSRLEEGKIAFEPKACSLVDMLNELCSSYGELNKDRKFNVDIDALPNSILADHKLLRQVFSNLLSNAIKYSPDGLNIWVTGKRNEHHELVISVRDEGLGIPEEELKKLFERFFRASTSTGIAGSGIGLHVVQHFVDLHGGKVEVESTVDVGTTFIVRLPISDPAETITANAA